MRKVSNEEIEQLFEGYKFLIPKQSPKEGPFTVVSKLR